ncbi:MAG TPA: STAS domain-containing protein [Deltaproteobacteria bacterium]|nr:STAS domain-containing protein [Deltaproteobacteria bacterium]
MEDIQLQDRGAGEGNLLVLRGALTIEAASRLRGALLKAYESQSALELDVRALESIDLACVQVLCSAHRTFHRVGRDIAIAGEITDGVRSALRAMAIDPEVCDSSRVSVCPWKEGDGHE